MQMSNGCTSFMHTCNIKKFQQYELSQDSVAHLTYALPINLLKSMTHDLDLKVSQVRHDGTA